MKKLNKFLQIAIFIFLAVAVSAQLPYCLPNYSTGCTWGDGLKNFQIGTIDQALSCSGSPSYYHDYRSQSVEIQAGDTEVLTVIAGYSSTYVDVWIDFNNNNVFDPDEIVVNDLACSSSNVPYQANISIPPDATAGAHVMRFRTNWISPVTNPCGQLSYGNAADFTVIVVGETPPVPLSNWGIVFSVSLIMILIALRFRSSLF